MLMTSRAEERSFLPTRRSLLSHLKDWADQESWARFFDMYRRLIHSTALKAGLTEAEAQDVLQETVLTVARKIKSFRYDPGKGSFKGWLLTITRWRIADQFRKRQKHVQPPRARRATEASSTATIERVPDQGGVDLDAVWEAEWEQTLLDAALARVKRDANPRHYQIFQLYALKQWPAGKVAQTLGVTPGQVRLAKHRVSEQLRREVVRLKREAQRGPLR